MPRPARSLLLAAATLAALTGSVAAAPTASAMLPDPSAQQTASLRTGYVAPVPAVPKGLPSGIEDLARYVPANSCDPHAKPGTTKLAELLKKTYAGSGYGIDRTCGTDPLPTSEHYDGRALDLMRTVRDAKQKAQVQAVISWLFAPDAEGRPYANARRLGVMYLIWDNRIWGAYHASAGWRPYSGCAAKTSRAYDTSCHRDHLHISLSWEGAMARTSFWSGKVAPVDYGPCRESGLNWAAPYAAPRSTACPAAAHVTAPKGSSALRTTLTTYSGMVLGVGSTGPVVRAVQQAVGLGGRLVDGSYGTVTAGAVSRWQAAHGVPASGVVDAATWRALLVAVATPATTAASPTPTAHPELTRYRHQVLRRGSTGAAVVALQRRLAMPHHPGTFGVNTQTKVKAFQRSHHLAASGVVRAATWTALGA